ncbi:hypothetical protein [Romboutsia ilealis]|uniref:hypothetical protein n=1 Tax=Romboutsia ilealis TaxID=1115758 RepID=UPI0023F505E8|nr:hypothetical protein [Romboutsia ilealis]
MEVIKDQINKTIQKYSDMIEDLKKKKKTILLHFSTVKLQKKQMQTERKKIL